MPPGPDVRVARELVARQRHNLVLELQLSHYGLQIADQVVLARNRDLDAFGDIGDHPVARGHRRVQAEHRVLVEVRRDVAARVDHPLGREGARGMLARTELDLDRVEGILRPSRRRDPILAGGERDLDRARRCRRLVGRRARGVREAERRRRRRAHALERELARHPGRVGGLASDLQRRWRVGGGVEVDHLAFGHVQDALGARRMADRIRQAVAPDGERSHERRSERQRLRCPLGQEGELEPESAVRPCQAAPRRSPPRRPQPSPARPRVLEVSGRSPTTSTRA